MVKTNIRSTTSALAGGAGRFALVAGALATAVFLAAAPVSAQDSGKPVQIAPKPAAKAKAKPAASEDKAAQVPEDQYPWVKICQKDPEGKNVCLIAKELHGANGELLASVALRDIEGEPKKTLLIAVPPGILVQPGMRVIVDKGKQEEVKYRICFPNACYADLEISDQMAGDMKKGNLLIVTALNLQQKPIGYPFRLDTFKTAAEGPGIDPTAGQQSQDQLQQELQKRADEAAKKLKAGEAPKP